MMIECPHVASYYVWRYAIDGTEYAFQRRCYVCGVLQSMGPSNDAPSVVQEEIEAANIKDHA